MTRDALWRSLAHRPVAIVGRLVFTRQGRLVNEAAYSQSHSNVDAVPAAHYGFKKEYALRWARLGVFRR